MHSLLRRWVNAFDLCAEAMAVGDDEMHDRRLARLEREVAALQARLARCGPSADTQGERRPG